MIPTAGEDGLDTCMYIYTAMMDTSYTYGYGTYISGIVYNLPPPPRHHTLARKRKKMSGGVDILICNPFVFLFFTLIPNMGVWVSPLYIYRDLNGYAPQNRGCQRKGGHKINIMVNLKTAKSVCFLE